MGRDSCHIRRDLAGLVALAALAALLAACPIAAPATPCDDDSQCPAGYRCNLLGFCTHDPPRDGGRDDAGAADASWGDSGGVDAGTVLVPSSVGHAVGFEEGRAALALEQASQPFWHVDTDTGAITSYPTADHPAGQAQVVRGAGTGVMAEVGYYQVPAQTSGAPTLAVFTLERLEIAAGARLLATGSLPLVLLVRTEAVIEGTLSVGANRVEGQRHPGAGGYPGSSSQAAPGSGPGGGGSGRTTSVSTASGGGGASHGGRGGTGGASTISGYNIAATSPGSTYGNPSLNPLQGGSGGGAGGRADASGGAGGSGGGAVQLSAGQRIAIALGGAVDACGGGGQGGPAETEGVHASGGGGGGGGAGGAVLLEAPSVEIAGLVGASGGAGGQAGGDSPGQDGADGRVISQAPGTPSLGEIGGGGAGSGADGQAEPGLSATIRGGGGGGGGGRILVRTASGAEVYSGLTPSTASGLAWVEAIRDPATGYVPSNFVSSPFDGDFADLVVGADSYVFWVVDTDSGSIVAYESPDIAAAASRTVRHAGEGDRDGVRFGPIPLQGGGAMGCFWVQRLELEPGSTLVGRGSLPLCWVVLEDASIGGLLSVGADRVPGQPSPGAGGHPGGASRGEAGEGPGGGACGVSSTGGVPSIGGAGAAFGSAGGRGGAYTTGSAPRAATPYGSAELVPLVGGSGGGSGGGVFSPSSGAGGGGGGGLQLSALQRIVIASSGKVGACGAGGKGGRENEKPGAGGGGGSGGAILLEAPVVEVQGFVGANGGAGGQASSDTGEAGIDGARGEPHAQAQGSGGSGGNGGGGAGSGADGAAENGGIGTSAGGGGGGGAGRVRVNTATGVEDFVQGISPNRASGLFTVGRIAD